MSNFAHLWYVSSLQHYELVVILVRLMGCEKYLELGVWAGQCIDEVRKHCDYCVGVDIADNRLFHDFEFRQCTTDEFFANNKEIFDIIFIDADHNFESVKKDFINSLNILNKFGLILIHDTDPIDAEYTNPGHCGDSYKMIDWISENYKDLNVLPLPITVGGLTIVNRKEDRRFLDYNKNII